MKNDGYIKTLAGLMKEMQLDKVRHIRSKAIALMESLNDFLHSGWRVLPNDKQAIKWCMKQCNQIVRYTENIEQIHAKARLQSCGARRRAGILNAEQWNRILDIQSTANGIITNLEDVLADVLEYSAKSISGNIMDAIGHCIRQCDIMKDDADRIKRIHKRTYFKNGNTHDVFRDLVYGYLSKYIAEDEKAIFLLIYYSRSEENIKEWESVVLRNKLIRR